MTGTSCIASREFRMRLPARGSGRTSGTHLGRGVFPVGGFRQGMGGWCADSGAGFRVGHRVELVEAWVHESGRPFSTGTQPVRSKPGSPVKTTWTLVIFR